MANAIQTQYYYLTGRPGYIEELLQKPSRLAEKWRVDACYYPDFLPFYEKVAKFIGSYLLLVVGLPLQGIAIAVNRCYREKIKPENYERQKAYWDNIIAKLEFTDYKERLTSELIKSRITSTVYTRIVYRPRGEEVYKTFFAQDGDFMSEPEQITERLNQGQRCLFLFQPPRHFKWHIVICKFSNGGHLPQNPNGIYNPDHKSGFIKHELRTRCLPQGTDCLLLTTKTSSVPLEYLEDPRIRRRLQEVLSPPQQLN